MTQPVPTRPDPETAARQALERIRTVIRDRAFRSRTATDKPDEATGPLVVRVNQLRAAIQPNDTPPDPPVKPTTPTGSTGRS